MDFSTSPTRLNATDHDVEKFIQFIESLRRGKYVSLRQSPTANSHSKGRDASSSDNSDTLNFFSFKKQEECGPVTTTCRSKNINNVPCVLGQDNSATNDNTWGCPRVSMTTSAGERGVSNVQNLMDHQHRSDHLSHHFSSRPLPCADPTRIPSFRPNQGRRQQFPQAGPDLDVNLLEEIIKGDDSEEKESLVSILEDSVFTLMLSTRLHCLYTMLIDACEGHQLDSLVERVLSRGKYFLSAAFAKQGASSIIKLIKKVNKSLPHAMAMTRVLSTRFMDIMTHPTARDVILQCLILFPRKPNEVLYEKVILHFQDLAIHEVGCRSLIDCIALIHGDQRVRLINKIADVSDYLSYDRHGNFVVQNLLGLKNKGITKKITCCLQNQFMGLAVRKEGCLVVEKCMEASDDGIIAVAKKIIDCRRGAVRLARNRFGNYVIQAVLEKTKERGFNSLYDAIVRQLEARCRASIGRTQGGIRSTQDAYIRDQSSLHEWIIIFM
ncbi:UNVERIFIED_CONTAM: hypothetical protein Sindi_1497900 [Sesamum indicum]